MRVAVGFNPRFEIVRITFVAERRLLDPRIVRLFICRYATKIAILEHPVG